MVSEIKCNFVSETKTYGYDSYDNENNLHLLKRDLRDMDITKLPRELLYEERTSLSGFEIDREGTIDCNFYNIMLNIKIITRVPNLTLNDAYLRIYNDAYFIVTLVLFDDRPELNFYYYCNIAEAPLNGILPTEDNNLVKQRCVLALVCAILSFHFLDRIKIRRFVNQLKEIVDKSDMSKLVYEDVLNLTTTRNMNTFEPCKLKPEILKNVNWEDVARIFNDRGEFQEKECSEIINKLGVDNNGKLMVISSMMSYFNNKKNENHKV